MVATDWERNLSHGCLSPTQTDKAVAPEIIRTTNSELRCKVACSNRGNYRKLEYIVQRCALFVLAKHVETVRVQIVNLCMPNAVGKRRDDNYC